MQVTGSFGQWQTERVDKHGGAVQLTGRDAEHQGRVWGQDERREDPKGAASARERRRENRRGRRR